MRLSAIWAQSPDGVIGVDGELPWHLPEDLDHFKRATVGAAVIMGRRTWESIPTRLRPLASRVNIVVTRDPDYQAPGALISPSLEVAARSAQLISQRTWVIGGAQMYAAAMPLLDELLVTEVDTDVAGDAFAPVIDDAFTLFEDGPWLHSVTGLRYRIRVYRRCAEQPTTAELGRSPHGRPRMRGPDPDRRTTPVIARYDAGSPEYTTACAPTAAHNFGE